MTNPNLFNEASFDTIRWTAQRIDYRYSELANKPHKKGPIRQDEVFALIRFGFELTLYRISLTSDIPS